MNIDEHHQNFLIRLLSKHPKAAFQYVAATLGMDQKIADQADEIFHTAKKIEIHPIGDKDNPGLMIILNQKFSLWFYRSGDEYHYDGFEYGDYSNDLDSSTAER